MNKNHVSIYRLVIVVLSVILIFTLVQSPRTTQAAPQAGGAQMLAVTVIDVPLRAKSDVTNIWVKLADLGTFKVHSADSLMELTYNGRIYASGVLGDTGGAFFELRVNDNQSTIGRAVGVVDSTVNGDVKVRASVSITGMFNGLAVGDHIASMWARSTVGTTATVAVNPNSKPVDVLIVKEHLPFGMSFLPMITK